MSRPLRIELREHGYTLTALAAFLGVHYATVSRALVPGERQMYARRYAQQMLTVVLQDLTPVVPMAPGRAGTV